MSILCMFMDGGVEGWRGSAVGEGEVNNNYSVINQYYSLSYS